MSESWHRIKTVLEAQGFIPAGDVNEDRYVGALKSGSISVKVEVTIEDYDFLILPRVKVLDRQALPKAIRGHLTEGDYLCYADRETFLLDRYQPDRSILTVLDRARDTLNILLHGNPARDIAAELFAYWGGQPYAFIDPPRTMTRATLGSVSFRNGYVLRVVASTPERMKAWAAAGNATYEVAGSISVLQCTGDILPPGAPIETFADALAWTQIQQCAPDGLTELAISASDTAPGLFLVGENGVLGFQAIASPTLNIAAKRGFRSSKRGALWLTEKDKLKIERLRGVPADHDEIVARNLAGIAPLSGKKIALIGCGTVGSYLARGLVQNGAGHGASLLLIDPDIFAPGNIGRHLLGARYIGRNKAEAMVEVLRHDFPDVEIEAVMRSAAACFSRLSGFDLVVDATGSEQFSDALNGWALASRNAGRACPPILYACLHGNGIAAQTFLATGRAEDACFRCQRPLFDQSWRYPVVQSAYETPDVAVRPCGEGMFVPFAVDATMVAAALALRHAIDAVSQDGRPTFRMRAVDASKARHQNDRTLQRSDKCPGCSPHSN